MSKYDGKLSYGKSEDFLFYVNAEDPYHIKLTKEDISILVDSLHQVSEWVEHEILYAGICSGLRKALRERDMTHEKTDQMIYITKSWSTEWDEYSGHQTYPVPAPAWFGGNAKEAYTVPPMWTSEYGESRRALMSYLTRRASKHLSAQARPFGLIGKFLWNNGLLHSYIV